jgi:hypothetical protein
MPPRRPDPTDALSDSTELVTAAAPFLARRRKR